MTNIELELTQACFSSLKRVCVNNKYMKDYDKNAQSKYIMYLDANNLYDWEMSQYLPAGNFRWMSDKEIDKIDLGKYKVDDKKGLILEVDLEYPQELHNLHNDYPACSRKIKGIQ